MTAAAPARGLPRPAEAVLPAPREDIAGKDVDADWGTSPSDAEAEVEPRRLHPIDEAAAASLDVGGEESLLSDGVLWRPSVAVPVAPRRNALRDLVAAPTPSQERPVEPLSGFPAESMPRRACPNCMRAMPKDIDDRQLHVLAIVGVTGATKSHFFASAMGLAENKQVLRDLGCTEFEVAAGSGSSFYEDYYVPFFKKGEELEGTPNDDSVRFKSITFRVTFEGHPPFLLMTHDVSGEALSNEQSRAVVTPFVRRASGVVFMVDPGEFDELYDALPEVETHPVKERRISQGALLGHLLDEIELQPGGRDVPVSVVVTKSDLLVSAMGRDFTFSRNSERGSGWTRDILEVDAEVRTMLDALGEVQLLQNAGRHGSVMFHAVSPSGGRPGSAGYTRPRPIRVEEPLGTVLRAISRIH
ncbi:hypothetical protein [Nocardioides zhouii]|uniref:Uncharacterized protein n=1 Tax=Nocardioides zhouii TaxID=1168729 RepID=A0A4Q2SNT3_9ACTN|nr:hypothetical protein [Nocardioides zhouii]RYC05738.1 hypothetical protein EUA94_17715 [Nocardioides zhouii]